MALAQLERLEQLLKQAMGLDAASIGSSAIERALQLRLEACRLHALDDYLQLVRHSADELQELIDAVVVPETWFFRDRAAFDALASQCVAPWLVRSGEGRLALLSIPCASGEEPYTLAMALLDAGVPPARFHIDAVDISARVLEQAERAQYGKNSFRTGDMGFRTRYFEADGASYWLTAAVRRQVTFRQGNLLDPDFALAAEGYDVIFCRNLLIYFDRPAQDRAIARLARLLKPDGTIFVGPSESGLLLAHDFASAKWPLAFAFRHAEAKVVPPLPSSLPARPVRKPAPPLRPADVAKPVASPAVPLPEPPDLGEAHRLANQGHLAEAARLAESHARQFGPSAQALHLMALVYDASGQHAEAERCYRKALYLDPMHVEALTHLALVFERQGDRQGAERLFERAERLKARGAASDE